MTLTLRPDVTATATGDSLVLLDQRSGRYWQLNATGALVLCALLNGSTPEQVGQDLSHHYPVSAEQATVDVTALVQQLSTAHLVTP
ncbi:lasso peptide biosynthesis PqqD family chaperone [Streptomyces actinomycinicus]|uniref:Lasso peptide biosynthesis PqqD family chaperone n=1 Tax=Streptomyces actinomycinicus TaxID=1695166 RepID=A0A937EFA8_9ACTN|nr:lasso peptide biosynthesis PqqD family chaperone [Streptomyces actinomycinicus]MBL1081079.1 lasso peptide biosynthesis PqqD family chaperone [Streptomyces actinomycinicus]